MNELGHSKNERLYHIGIFILFLVCGLSVFFINMTFTDVIPGKIRVLSKIGLIIILLTSSILLYRSKIFKRYWRVFFAFFTASIAIFLSLHISHFGLHFFNLTIASLNGFFLYKILEDLLIIFLIILLIKLSGGNMTSIYVTRGNLRLGLSIGLISFVICFILAVLYAAAQNQGPGKFISLTPVILIIALADGFMEELLFRGLFLKRFEPFFRAKLSNFLTAIIFALAHVRVTYTPYLPVYLIIVFFLGLILGHITQKTGSLLGPALFHAGVDVIIMMDFFSSFGVT